MARRYVGLDQADSVYHLPDGVTVAWVALGYVHQTWFVDHGVIKQGVRVAEMSHAVAQVRARLVATARAPQRRPPVC